MTEFVHNRKRAITNTIACLVFLLMAVAVMFTRATWWATALMAVFVVWAIGGVIVNAMAIQRGFPKSQLPGPEQEQLDK
ncbi:MAG TPA: hypothetical protein VGE93_01525 [Bryobacteraceae bacterium]